jgi:AraC family ethanolamine operon transcriptional activator
VLHRYIYSRSICITTMPDIPLAKSWIQLQETTDMDQHSSCQEGWALRYQQMSPGKFTGRLLQVYLPDVTLLREDTNIALHQRGRLDNDAYGFATALSDVPDLFFNGRQVPSCAIMCGKVDDVDLNTPVNFSLLAIVVKRSLLNPLWEHMYQKPLAPWLERQLVLPTTAVKVQSLRAAQLAILEYCSSNPQLQPDAQALHQLRDEILIEWIEAIPSQVDTSELVSLARKKKLVDRACEIMMSSKDEPLSILEICSRVGTCRRKLNTCFQDVLGTTPVKYLRSLRLNGVRRALCAAGPNETIQNVASHWGFWHLSQFTADYKKLFGELPSSSLRNRN